MLPLLNADKALLAAATANKLTPEILAQASAADRAIDADYLAAEVPKALGQCQANIERIADIIADIQAGSSD